MAVITRSAAMRAAATSASNNCTEPQFSPSQVTLSSQSPGVLPAPSIIEESGTTEFESRNVIDDILDDFDECYSEFNSSSKSQNSEGNRTIDLVANEFNDSHLSANLTNNSSVEEFITSQTQLERGELSLAELSCGLDSFAARSHNKQVQAGQTELSDGLKQSEGHSGKSSNPSSHFLPHSKQNNSSHFYEILDDGWFHRKCNPSFPKSNWLRIIHENFWIKVLRVDYTKKISRRTRKGWEVEGRVFDGDTDDADLPFKLQPPPHLANHKNSIGEAMVGNEPTRVLAFQRLGAKVSNSFELLGQDEEAANGLRDLDCSGEHQLRNCTKDLDASFSRDFLTLQDNCESLKSPVSNPLLLAPNQCMQSLDIQLDSSNLDVVHGDVGLLEHA